MKMWCKLESVKAMYPYASSEARKIVFGTDEGETYIINLK